MTPLSFEWQWNIDHYIFMGFLYLALAFVGSGLIYVFIRTWVDLHQKEGDEEAPPDISYRSKSEETPPDISYRERYSQY